MQDSFNLSLSSTVVSPAISAVEFRMRTLWGICDQHKLQINNHHFSPSNNDFLSEKSGIVGPSCSWLKRAPGCSRGR